MPKPKLLTILFLVLCISMSACTDWFKAPSKDDDKDDEEAAETSDSSGGPVMAPNIYLYPEASSEISVKLSFTSVDDVFTHTDPEYNDGWNVWVEPDGLIDGTYDYLYYSVWLSSSMFQRLEGWAVPEEDVFQWFEETLLKMGFTQHETDDFIDYWIENLPYSPCYHIYPQYTELADAHIPIDIEPEPDTLERMWFLIDETDFCEALLEPEEIIPFEREGFTVVEWGVFFPDE